VTATTPWRVSSGQRALWNVAAPGGHQWTGAPSQPAAFNLARSLAAIDTMLAGIHRPALTVVHQPSPKYGCYRMPAKAH
jgi:hypothetical protein